MGSALGAGSLTQQILNRKHSFSTYAKFYEELPFFPPDAHLYVRLSGGKKCLLFGKLYVRTK